MHTEDTIEVGRIVSTSKFGPRGSRQLRPAPGRSEAELRALRAPLRRRHPSRLAPSGAGVDGLVTEFLLDAHELVVLGVAVRTARRAGLDLASAQADREISDGRVLGLARPVRTPC